MINPSVLIAEGAQDIHQSLTGVLFQYGCQIIETTEKADIIRLVFEKKPDLILIESSRTEEWDGLRVARKVRNSNNEVPIILVTKPDYKDDVLKDLGDRVKDYVIASARDEELMDIIRQRFSQPMTEVKNKDGIDSKIIGNSTAMKQVKSYIENVAPTDCTVLITGETGTGKELIAQMIHQNSKRAEEPFICINCAAIPESLLESELFGYEKGTFTGAHNSYPGKFNLAGKGTIFLDEIGDMSLSAQTKILRVLETREVYSLGAKRSVSMNARIISATNQDLEKLMTEGRFRADLYFRLNVARVELPALRNRKEDLILLLEHFIEKFNQEYGVNVEGVSKEALDALLYYSWHGNIRELKNLIEASYINSPTKEITLNDFPRAFTQKINEMEKMTKGEREQILSALYDTRWNKSMAAEKLEWSRMTLYRKMKKYNIVKKPDYKK